MIDPREMPRAMSFFDRVKPEIAQRMLKRLQRDPDFLFALRQVHETAGNDGTSAADTKAAV